MVARSMAAEIRVSVFIGIWDRSRAKSCRAKSFGPAGDHHGGSSSDLP
jgi:hypothetical protein